MFRGPQSGLQSIGEGLPHSVIEYRLVCVIGMRKQLSGSVSCVLRFVKVCV